VQHRLLVNILDVSANSLIQSLSNTVQQMKGIPSVRQHLKQGVGCSTGLAECTNTSCLTNVTTKCKLKVVPKEQTSLNNQINAPNMHSNYAVYYKHHGMQSQRTMALSFSTLGEES